MTKEEIIEQTSTQFEKIKSITTTMDDAFFFTKPSNKWSVADNVKHLLISTNSSKDEKVIAAKRKTADSLLKVINTNNFTELVTKYTEDPGSKTTGGLYENFLEAEMVKEFGSFCATQAIGKIGIV